MIEETIRYSLRHKSIINIIYHGSSGISQRKIKVLNIEGKKVTAYCYTRKSIRTFKLDSILGASIDHENNGLE